MQIRDITNEASPDSLEGSFTNDLVDSKLWLCEKLKQGLRDQCARTIYILGSWYGNLALLIEKAGIKYDNIVLVEIADDVLKSSELILKPLMDPGKLIFLHTDAKDVVYDEPGIVINTSVNDMDTKWYDKVPNGMRVIVQGRDQASGAKTKIADLEQFDDMFPMEQVNYLGSKKLDDPETYYTRYMKIGKK